MLMDTVWKEPASARKVGRAQTAVKWTRMLSSVFQIVLVMVPSIWIRKHARANLDGQEMTAQEVIKVAKNLKAVRQFSKFFT